MYCKLTFPSLIKFSTELLNPYSMNFDLQEDELFIMFAEVFQLCKLYTGVLTDK